jgi:hypothetical protein
VLRCSGLAEGVGFEPTETHKTSTVFETVPFVRSGILPGGRLSVWESVVVRQCFLKTVAVRADGSSVADANLFPDEAGFTPRPAWQVIEAARRRYLTAELTLPTAPATRIYLRDGLVYFAERVSDGTLPIRLMMEGVITREQMQRGTVIVNGVEHVGRMFDADPTIDRASVELCVELFSDDVMVTVANMTIDGYTLALYRRHPSGIDRWYPHSVPVSARQFESPAASPAKPVANPKPKSEVHVPEARVETKPEPRAEPRNNLNAPPITQAVPVTAPVVSTGPPPPPITQVLPLTTQIPVTPMPAPTAQIPVTPAGHAPAGEVDASVIADEVAEAIKRAFAGMSSGRSS